MSRLAISKIITTKHQNRAWLLLILYWCRLVLLSHFSITKLFNDHILFQKYTPFKFVCLPYIGQSSFTFLLHEHLNRSFFLSHFLLYHYSDFWCYRLLYYGKFLKNREKIRTNLEQYILKIMKILRTASLRSNFTGSYKKRVLT